MTKHVASEVATDNSLLAGVVPSGIGGSGKSTFTLTLADLADVSGLALDILQFDHQSKLGETLGRDIVTLNSAIARKSRSNPDAIVELFEPFTGRLAALKDTKRSVLIEIGGGLTPIFHDHNRLVDLNEDLVELGVHLTVFLVVLATPEAIGQATVELDRLKEILPDARVVVVENRWRDARCSGRPRKAASSSEHIASITGSSPISACPARITTAPGAAKVLDESDVAALFGLEMAETPHTPNPAFTVQSDPNTPRRKKARYLPERPSQQRRPMSPYIVRLGPVRERKRQPEQVPGNAALGGDHSIPMMPSGPHGTERAYRPADESRLSGLSGNAENMWARIQNWR